jgi:anti-sigma regulatory factor (Ser/Thr protein kinase)
VNSPPFEASISLHVEALRGFRTELRAWLERVEALDAQREDVVLATHEAVANALEHADDSSQVTVRGLVDGRVLVLCVENSGPWRVHEERGRGRGLMLMKALMTELDIRTDAEHTVVRMRKDLANGAGDLP